ncbi:hypothetical protein J2S55_007369 [Streptosporangium brasiliense]|uniref:Uncharacterized protein n=1 Tax=Streptosporangium brasiliense TaxID=47480 RepID=A0ABT9RG62_9ACTN|nr:hypothetical protein [Streptosporangium brasiliense]
MKEPAHGAGAGRPVAPSDEPLDRELMRGGRWLV